MKGTKIIIVLVVIALIVASIFYIMTHKDNNNNNNNDDTIATSTNVKTYSMMDIYEYVNDIENTITSINYIILGTPEDDTTLDEATAKLNNDIDKYADYNNYIDSLKDSKYDTLKNAWQKYFEEVNRLKSLIDTSNYNDNDGIITNGTLDKYYNIINEETYNLK